MTYRSLKLSEKEFQDQVLEAADKAGWWRHHDHDSRKQDWRADSGFPDLVLAKDGRIIFAELKAEKGRMSSSQLLWIDHLQPNAGVEVYIWRPDDWDEIVQVLQ